MKIVCDSCGAKYSIADEKVAGKVFKIRCKKCSAVIVVKGDQPAEGDEAARGYDFGADAVWHVVIDGDQQGPFAPRQIADLLAEAKIDWEAYVWREGMDGWQPAKDVEALVSAVMDEAEGGEAAAAPAAARAAYGSGQVFGGTGDMGADPFAAQDDGGLAGVIGQPTASASAAGGGADLFAQSAGSPFSGAAQGASGMSNGQAPRVSEGQAMTGQRNENSVLFSLSNLQALATGSEAAPASSKAKAGMAAGEGSGLIDIRALASASQAVGEGKKANGTSKDSVEDLLSVGSASTFTATSLAAPVEMDKQEGGNNKLILMALTGTIALLIALLGFMYFDRTQEGAPIAELPTATSPEATAAAAAQATAAPTAPGQQAQAAGAQEPTADEADSEDEAGDEGDDTSSSKRKAHTSKPRRSRAKSSGSSSSSSSTSSAAAAPSKPSSSGDKSLDDLLDSALGGKPAPKQAAAPSAPAADSSLPSLPGRDDVIAAMKDVTPRVKACGTGTSGVATTKVTVAGATGRVTRVAVSGQFAGTPVAACVVKQVSKARFPKFKSSTFSVSYPFAM